MRSALDHLLARSPVQTVYRRRSSGVLTVLGYHDVTDVANFGRQLDYLVAHYTPLGPAEVVRCMRGEVPWPEAPALVTFDDGDRSVLERGLPELTRRDVPALVFVITGLLDTETPPWWVEVEHLVDSGGGLSALPDAGAAQMIRAMKRLAAEERLAALEELRATASRPTPPCPQLRSGELRELERHDVAVGNHTETHPCLPRCPAPKVRAEIHRAHRALESALGHPPIAFAFPNGDIDARADAALGELGYDLALGFDHRQQALPVGEPLRISRLRVNSTDRLERFQIVLSGLHPRLHRLLGRS